MPGVSAVIHAGKQLPIERFQISNPQMTRPISQQTRALTGTVTRLLTESDFEANGAARGQFTESLIAAIDQSVATANAAFDFELPEALDDAHRTLYALYADRIWRAPSQPRPVYARHSFELIRMNLEQGFRHYLAKRREDSAAVEPPHDRSHSEWLEELALGDHPHEDNAWAPFIRERITLDQLKEIVAQRSLFFLREPDPWIYAVPTLTQQPKAGLIDLLLDEYGWGKLDRMHSSVYAQLMDTLGLNSQIDHFEHATSWQYLACLNLTEADSPGAMTNYLAAWKRLGVDDQRVLEFYEIHVHADENHRDVALHEVVAPVCAAEEAAAREVAIGIFDGRTVEAEFAEHLKERFSRGESSLSNAG
jgi:hypothetical protein